MRKIISAIYRRIVLYRFRECLGFFSLLFNKVIFEGFSVGKKSKIYGSFHVVQYKNGKIFLGDNVLIVSSHSRAGIGIYAKTKLSVFENAQLKIGSNVALNGCIITAKKKITIGDNTMIAPNVIVVDSDFHIPNNLEQRHNLDCSDYDKEVCIGNNVWLGMNAIILKGVNIGDNSIVAAGSVVVRDVPAGVVVAGNPAKVVKQLDDGK